MLPRAHEQYETMNENQRKVKQKERDGYNFFPNAQKAVSWIARGIREDEHIDRV
jgi:hypothetical protein